MKQITVLALLIFSLTSCAQPSVKALPTSPKFKTAYFAAGCFWCVEAVFESIEGVEDVTSGYAGGTEKNPTYELVCSGNSNHAETIKITYDSTKINFDTLLTAFFSELPINGLPKDIFIHLFNKKLFFITSIFNFFPFFSLKRFFYSKTY
jgi:hypothetical protein